MFIEIEAIFKSSHFFFYLRLSILFMQKFILILIVFTSFVSKSQSLYFPPTTGSTWDTLSAQSLGWCVGSELDSLYSFLSYRNSKGFVVLKDGKIVLEKYFGAFTKDSNWYWASASKTLTAFAVGIAQENGLLNIQHKTSQYLSSGWTSCSSVQEDSITLWHHLTMTTGLDDGVPDDNCIVDTCLIYKAPVLARWAYHNAPYRLLQDVIDSAAIPTFNGFVQQKIRSKIGMNGLFYDYTNYSTTRSMARFGLLMLAKGTWDTTTVLADTNYFNAMINTSQSKNVSYGYLTWLNGKASYRLPQSQLVFPGKINPNAPDDMYAAIGKDGQIINVVPSQNLVVVRMGNNPNDGSLVPTTFNTDVWQYLNAVICTANTVHVEHKINEFDFYPNPSHNYITLRNNSSVSLLIEIKNMQGQIVFSLKMNEGIQTIDVGKLPRGIYFIRAGEEYGKIVLN
jgi:CubicO group peptidase (beta-lactamase class C family)